MYVVLNFSNIIKYICQCEIFIDIPNTKKGQSLPLNVGVSPMAMCAIVRLCSCLDSTDVQLYNRVSCEDYIIKLL